MSTTQVAVRSLRRLLPKQDLFSQEYPLRATWFKSSDHDKIGKASISTLSKANDILEATKWIFPQQRIAKALNQIIRRCSKIFPNNKNKKENKKTAAFPKHGVIKALNLHEISTNPSKTTIIFIHYHPAHWFAPGYVKLIQSACESGYRVIVASNVRPSRSRRIMELGKLAYIQRANIGYDFGAIRDVRTTLDSLGLLADGRYVILNSSMLNLASAGFGNDSILDKLADQNTREDILGVTSSYETTNYHIQTYFYSVSGFLFCSKQFAKILDSYWLGLSRTKLAPREYAIKHYELKFTRWALRAGFTVAALFEHFHLPSCSEFRQMSLLAENLKIDLGNDLDSLSLLGRPDLPSLLEILRSEWLPKPGFQQNTSQACWALLLINGFLFIKRESIENQGHHGNHSLGILPFLLPTLRYLNVATPEWSDLHALPRLIHSSKPSKKDSSSIAAKP